MLLALRNINKEERVVRVHKLLLKVPLIAAFDLICVEKHVWYFHQGAVHAVLGVKERVWVASFYES